MTQVECPFCKNPNFIADAGKGRAKKISVLWPRWHLQGRFWREKLRKLTDDYRRAASIVAEQRGESLRIVLEGEDFEERWRDFTVEVFGVEAAKPIFPRDSDRVIPGPPSPFFFFGSVADTNVAPFRYQHFFVARITHKLSNVEMIVHWWPTHGRLFTMGGKLSAEYPNDDIELFRSAFDFFHRETRGSAKVTDTEIKKVVALLGAKATQRNAAKVLNVSESTLEKWRQRQGISTWKEVVKSYSLSP